MKKFLINCDIGYCNKGWDETDSKRLALIVEVDVSTNNEQFIDKIKEEVINLGYKYDYLSVKNYTAQMINF